MDNVTQFRRKEPGPIPSPRNDLVGHIGIYTTLKKSGRQYRGRCPFHEEKTGSFTVDPKRQTFKCYGCGVQGDGETFLDLTRKHNPEPVNLMKVVGLEAS